MSLAPESLAPELLEIICCPDTHQPLKEIDPSLVAKVNEQIAANQLKTKAGEAVVEPIDGGLLREDKQVLYPVREGIPVLLVDEGVVLPDGF